MRGARQRAPRPACARYAHEQRHAPSSRRPGEPRLTDDLLDAVDPLERERFDLEEKHGRMWDVLADHVHRRPEEFVRQS
jgi:hypothetical protein